MKKDRKVYLTEDGLKQLKEELTHLKDIRRQEVAAKLKRALEFGDLSENAEYQEAKEDQAFVESRIIELDNRMKYVELIEDGAEKEGVVQMGSRVILKNMTDTEEDEGYTIVGTMEADPLNGRISNESPIGNIILDRKKGETVKVKVPAGIVEYKIISVK